MKIDLRNGLYTLVDDGDWERLDLGRYSWHAKRQACGRIYAATNLWDREQKRMRSLRMHRLILDAPPDRYVDHINGDTLDNRRANLRLATNAENQQNSGARKGASRYKGVHWFTRHGKWKVSFNWRGKTYFVGYFANEEEAARAYDAAIVPLAGEFARLNFPNA